MIRATANTATAFLADHWQRLALDRFGASGALTCVVATPRFRASAHVVFLILTEGSDDATLVVKISRLPGASISLDREAANLRAVQAARARGFDSIPRLIACEEYAGTQLLVETALAGRVMRRSIVRRRPVACTESLLAWLIDLHGATAEASMNPGAAFERLVADPLDTFDGSFVRTRRDAELIARTRDLTSPLRDAPLPLVFEHGDLSAPNVLLTRGGGLGVVDWELADPRGLPGQDLFFALTYVAFSLRRATRVGDQLAAFHHAFFGPHAWTRPYVERYARALGLADDLLPPLFIACWSRYVVRLAARIDGSDGPGSDRGDGTAEWLRANRYFALWRHTLEHFTELQLTERSIRRCRPSLQAGTAAD